MVHGGVVAAGGEQDFEQSGIELEERTTAFFHEVGPEGADGGEETKRVHCFPISRSSLLTNYHIDESHWEVHLLNHLLKNHFSSCLVNRANHVFFSKLFEHLVKKF